ncbi:hypothetical protein GCM10011289_29170 [Paludibacterium paludis]|uniref:Transposase DDE domain-containing protein n=1 Tax=Paludibacterium paludis TaxID=1225769 RepID=A0A918P6Q7_9NEIS|nr:hypothetical protein GCM10011289_29170 [Paludibacterium paludis]
MQSLLKLAGLGWTAPDYSTVCRRQKTLQVNIPYRHSHSHSHSHSHWMSPLKHRTPIPA